MSYFLSKYPFVIGVRDLTEAEVAVIMSGTHKEKNELRNSLINPSVEYCECPDIWSKVDEELRAILYFKLDSNAIL